MVFTEVKDEEQFNQLIQHNNDNPELTLCYFTAKWCGPCQTISPIVENIGKNNSHLSVLKIDVDVCEEVSEQCEITCMPTFQFYKHNSPKPIHSFSGADKTELVNTIELLLKTDGEVPTPEYKEQNNSHMGNQNIEQVSDDNIINNQPENSVSGFSGSHQMYANLNNDLNNF